MSHIFIHGQHIDFQSSFERKSEYFSAMYLVAAGGQLTIKERDNIFCESYCCWRTISNKIIYIKFKRKCTITNIVNKVFKH